MNAEETLYMLNQGQWVCAGAKDSPAITAMLQRCAMECHRLNGISPLEVNRRADVLRQLLGSCGTGVMIHSPFRCDFGFNIHIGDNFTGNFNLTILDEAKVEIGDNVMIGPNCSLITITHSLDSAQRNAGVMTARPITISDDVWIAANVVILPGVAIGRGSVIGAGSIVTRDVPEGVVAVGNPCRVLRSITAADKVTVAG